MVHQYRIDSVLGRHPSGITYYAWDTELERPSPSRNTSPLGLANRETTTQPTVNNRGENQEEYHEGLEDFLDEAKALAAFNHTIVHVHQRGAPTTPRT